MNLILDNFNIEGSTDLDILAPRFIIIKNAIFFAHMAALNTGPLTRGAQFGSICSTSLKYGPVH